jgi:selenocysteine lyase/cysteine desulfurase
MSLKRVQVERVSPCLAGLRKDSTSRKPFGVNSVVSRLEASSSRMTSPSLALYNTCEDVDALVAVLLRIRAGRGL